MEPSGHGGQEESARCQERVGGQLIGDPAMELGHGGQEEHYANAARGAPQGGSTARREWSLAMEEGHARKRTGGGGGASIPAMEGSATEG